MILLDEPLPDDPVFAAAVLHLRKHVRRSARRGRATEDELALLFGVAPEATEFSLVQAAASMRDPVLALTQALGQARGVPVIALGHDAEYREMCRRWLVQRKHEEPAFGNIIADDLATLLVLSLACDVATAAAPDAPGAARRVVPILIQGETGTGKELLARAIHAIWKRETKATGEFVVLHVAGMSSHLVDDELFGHVRGAFTGAEKDRKGRLESADGGTLLIDEVGDLSDESQQRLLRFLQDQTFSPLGKTDVRSVSVRILAATWHDLEARVAAGAFRRDLLFRLRVGSLVLPPLSAREGFFDGTLDALLQSLGQVARPPLTRAARDALRGTLWPGHLRQLVGVLRQAMASADGDTLRLEDLPSDLQRVYVALPLHDRAPGFLEEEHASQGRPAEIVAWRIGAIDQSLAREPEPPLPPELAALAAFSAAIPDPSPEHTTSVEGLAAHVSLVSRFLVAERAAQFWDRVATSGLSTDVAKLVREHATEANRAARDLRTTASADCGHVAAANSPWVRLLTEMGALPVLSDQPQGAIAQVLVGAMKLVFSVAPDWAADVRLLVQKHGFAGLLERAKQAVEDARTEGVVEAMEPESSSYKTYTRDDWLMVLRNHPSKQSAAQDLRVDTKTIGRYLVSFGLEKEPWGAQRRDGGRLGANGGAPAAPHRLKAAARPSARSEAKRGRNKG